MGLGFSGPIFFKHRKDYYLKENLLLSEHLKHRGSPAAFFAFGAVDKSLSVT
jgi:hypothetical protein